MQPKIIVLLAVLADVTTAGLVRHDGRFIQ